MLHIKERRANDLQEMHTSLAADADRFFIPDAGLHLADMGCAEQEHTKAGLTYTAAHRQRKLALKKAFMEGEIFSLLKSSFAELRKKRFPINSDTHRGNFKGQVKGLVIKDYISVKRPIIIVGRAAAVGLAVGELAAYLHNKYSLMLLDEAVLPFLGGEVGIEAQKLL